MTSQRVVSAVVFAALFLTALYWRPLGFLVPAIALGAAILGTVEYCLMARAKKHAPVLWLAVLVAALLVLCGASGRIATMLPVLAVVVPLSGAAIIFRNRTEAAIADMAVTLFGGIYVGMSIGLLLGLRAVASAQDRLQGAYLLLFIIAVTWVADSGAYFVGRARGRTRLCERLSPKKSVEGLLGGFAATFLLAILIRLLPFPGREILSWGDVFLLATAYCVVGPLGDLTASVMKRDADVKDSGLDFTGHGGMLDIIDSLLFTAPVTYLYLFATCPDLF